MPDPGSSYNAAKLVRRSLFFVLLVSLSVVSLFVTFSGLSSPRGMEQAQVGREISRGNGYVTKVARPAAIMQMHKAKEGKYPRLDALPETYHAPLNCFTYAAALKLADAGNEKRWRMPQKSNIYKLDRVIAALCTIFFLISIGVNYLLVSRIFDQTIASVMAILMLFCELMWKFTHTGLPQMLMLMLFSCAMFFLWRAIENSEENRPALGTIIASGIFMCLLVLSHWLAVWVYIGFVIFAAFYFKPRGVIAALLLGLLAIFVIPVVALLYYGPTNSFLGSAFYAIYNGLGFSEDSIMRSLTPENEELAIQGLILNILRTTLLQITDLLRNFGNILVAPLFFLALLHPFKRATLAHFRWAILLMWVFAALGMSIYGIREALEPNQIHILFAPLMTAYGLAIVSILWSRLNIPNSLYALRHAHLIAIVIISAGPMLLSLPQEITQGIRSQKRGGMVQWPPYFPAAFNRTLADNTSSKDIIISDTPWAVAWYADRVAVWLPQNLESIEKVEKIAADQQTPVSGITISPYSFSQAPIYDNAKPGSSYGDLFPLVYDSWAKFGTNANLHFIDMHPKFKPLSQRYENKHPLFSYGWLMFYSKRPIVRPEE